MIDGRNVDYSKVIIKTGELINEIQEIKKDFSNSISQDLFHWYDSKSKEIINVLEDIDFQLYLKSTFKDAD